MEAQRATETTLTMIMCLGMVMTRKREQLVSTSSRLNVNIRLVTELTAPTCTFVFKKGPLGRPRCLIVKRSTAYRP